jgi:hypothetical protein
MHTEIHGTPQRKWETRRDLAIVPHRRIGNFLGSLFELDMYCTVQYYMFC